MRDLLLVGFLMVAVFYALRRPYLGITAWVWIALIAPSEWTFGFSRSFRLNLTIVLVTAVAYVFARRSPVVGPHGSYALPTLVLAFGAWTLVTTIFNLSTSPDRVWDYWVQFIKIIALFLFTFLILRRQLHINTVVWAVVLGVSSYAAMEGVKFILSGGSHRIVGRAGIIADRNDLAVAMNMCLPFVVYLLTISQRFSIRVGLWVLLVLNVVAIVGTYSRGGFIGLAILAVAFWLRTRFKAATAALIIVLIPVLYQMAPEDWRERQSTIGTAAVEDSSFIGRLWAWKISTLIALDYPVTGGGFGAVTDPVIWNNYAPLTPAFGPIETPSIPTSLRPKAAHNIYMQVLGDHGFVGLFLFVGALSACFFANLGSIRAGRLAGADWYRRLASSINLSLIGYGVTGANVSLAYFDLVYAIFGIVAVMTVYRFQLLGSGHS